MKPFSFNGTAVFSSVAYFTTATTINGVNCPANTPCITWQHKELGTSASQIGNGAGATANIPNYNMVAGQNVIVAEVFMSYSPMLVGVTDKFIPALAQQTLYKLAVYKPRQGSLTTCTGC